MRVAGPATGGITPTLALPLQGGGDVFIGPLPHQGECFIGRLPPSLMEDRRSRLNLSSPLAGEDQGGGEELAEGPSNNILERHTRKSEELH